METLSTFVPFAGLASKVSRGAALSALLGKKFGRIVEAGRRNRR